ncbi:MAG TPA: hypothetical protein VJ970_02985 [Flavobacteriaceae bacterium]|nr:hypothetical protein [Flavobacteriaceae bacterium]
MKNLFTLTLLLLFINISYAQTKRYIDTGSVKNQFDYLITKSNNYKAYKVVSKTWLQRLKGSVLDSISGYQQTNIKNNNIILKQQQTIDSLKNVLDNSNTTITGLNTQIETISLLGIEFKKDFFKTLLFSIIGILILFLLLFFTKFKQSNTITQQVKNRLKETEDEYEEHRKVALEREQKVMRRLQDELNKQKKE